jgi:hypothetical protein
MPDAIGKGDCELEAALLTLSEEYTDEVAR